MTHQLTHQLTHQHLGSCLCGAAQFKLEGDFERFFFCYCAHCRKDTGSAHAANLFSSSAKLEWIAGADKISTFNLPQTRHTRCFCSVCGSAMPYVSEQMIVVPAGCLDTALNKGPDAHIFVASKAAWTQASEIPAFDTFPT